ncbi:CRISPR-associated endonuclease Cas2 [Methanococcus maripaludis]|jgi:CRISPR-associated protein Cas2|uniref:CRISPR-associated endoribonuclease Cas2 n=4 Tax=Methanococcus maripaludis TaxID=39152 RepID=A0A8T3VXB6_METMI|nr:CRISPR-associated endonuclease Cas2 [Methanococcus maripaludis]AEK19975.1 CRISPR-associated Cas2 family protein [Methanococcus maripaludis X1]MBG0768541.1 CRISPR-associated endonuclease Cas2 [Methanococcus maripaludis]BAP61182.1 CRISPR-associated protein Cas2 [Methanococcus maripaludis KA1]BAP63128.1 CRISPR-associated protein Cas2 [Methanococcus maripaludis OS7]
MLLWVIYDISNDKIRSKVSKTCLNYGLYRVQKSVFLGEVESNSLDELKILLEDTIDMDIDSVYVFPMSKDELNKAGLIGQAFDKELVSDEIVSKFF